MEQNSSNPRLSHTTRSAVRRDAERSCARVTDDGSLVAFEQAEQALAGAGIRFSVVQQRGPAPAPVSRLASAA